jgi:hypothetical protein
VQAKPFGCIEGSVACSRNCCSSTAHSTAFRSKPRAHSCVQNATKCFKMLLWRIPVTEASTLEMLMDYSIPLYMTDSMFLPSRGGSGHAGPSNKMAWCGFLWLLRTQAVLTQDIQGSSESETCAAIYHNGTLQSEVAGAPLRTLSTVQVEPDFVSRGKDGPIRNDRVRLQFVLSALETCSLCLRELVT